MPFPHANGGHEAAARGRSTVVKKAKPGKDATPSARVSNGGGTPEPLEEWTPPAGYTIVGQVCPVTGNALRFDRHAWCTEQTRAGAKLGELFPVRLAGVVTPIAYARCCHLDLRESERRARGSSPPERTSAVSTG